MALQALRAGNHLATLGRLSRDLCHDRGSGTADAVLGEIPLHTHGLHRCTCRVRGVIGGGDVSGLDSGDGAVGGSAGHLRRQRRRVIGVVGARHRPAVFRLELGDGYGRRLPVGSPGAAGAGSGDTLVVIVRRCRNAILRRREGDQEAGASREAGEKGGFALGEQKALILIEKLEMLIRELISLKETLTKELEPQMVELVFSIARTVIRKELTTNPEAIVAITKEALTRLGKTGQIIIKINPSLSDLFMKHKPELTDIYPDLIFDIDPSVAQDGSVVIGPTEDIITDIDEQLKNLIRELGCKLVRD